jgi:hypothetical protein
MRKLFVTEFMSMDGVMKSQRGRFPIGMTRSPSLRAKSRPLATPCSWAE